MTVSPAAPGTPAQTPPFGIRVKGGRHKSIALPLEWQPVPPFAIITGLNGGGKTQFLEAVAMHYDHTLRQQFSASDLQIEALDHTYRQHDVFLIKDFAKTLSHDHLHPSNYSQTLTSFGNQSHSSVYDQAIRQLIKQAPPDAFPHDAFYLNFDLIDRAVSFDFFNFMIEESNALRARGSHHDLGDPPWTELNRLLDSFIFPYRFVGPDKISMAHPLRLHLLHTETGQIVLPRDLSSGEASIFRFILFSFAANKLDGQPKLFLLDEPDAHLHASLIQSFLSGVQKVLVEMFGFRVLMSSHRTETIAFAPEGTLYEMRRAPPRLRRSDEKARTISMLTGSMISFVYGGKRPVFVEDQPDVMFYRIALAILVEHEEWSSEVVPEFLPAAWFGGLKSLPHGKPKGGKGNVRHVVEEFNSLGFDGVVSGIVDLDTDCASMLANIYQLKRHSRENYLLDPIYIFVYVLHHERAPEVELENGISISREHELREWPSDELQKIVDVVVAGLRNELSPVPSGDEECARRIEYTNGASICVPAWLLERRGKDVRVAAKKFAAPCYFSDRELQVAMQRVRLVPASLREVLEAAIGHTGAGIPSRSESGNVAHGARPDGQSASA